MKEIPLTQGKVAQVDDEWYDRLSAWKWHFHRTKGSGYAARHTPRVPGKKRKFIMMHNEIMKPPEGVRVDHRDGNGLNNQTYNLRHCTNTQNAQNRGIQKNNRSGYKGVKFLKPDRHYKYPRYQAQIVVNGVQLYLGVFRDPAEAAKTYDRAAREHFGPFARLNFPEED